MDDDSAIPPAARFLRDLVNTYEPQVDHESLGSVRDLQDWIRSQESLSAIRSLRSADLERVRTVREGLRSLLLGNAGHATDDLAVEKLNMIMKHAPITVRLDEDGGYQLDAAGMTPIDDLLVRVIEAILRSREEGSWHRLKVCDRATCRWAYYDTSRNQSRRWCSMAGCGNYIKMRRAYATRTGRGPT